MPKDRLRVGLVQHASADTRAACTERSERGVREAAGRGAELIVLQELHNGPYFPQREDPGEFDRAEAIPGPTTAHFAAVAREYGVTLVASVFERRAPGVYHNSAAVIDADGNLAGVYRKMHIPDDPGYYEKYYFTPGDLGFEPIDSAAGRLGVLVCWDQWYPEAARLMALAGAELLIYPTAIGWDPDDDPAERERQRAAWQLMQRSHAVANGLPVLSCNRTGYEPDPAGWERGIEFWGSSFVAGPQGELLAEAPSDEEHVLVTDIDRGRSERVRRAWPFLRDRRIDAYGDLQRRLRDRPPQHQPWERA